MMATVSLMRSLSLRSQLSVVTRDIHLSAVTEAARKGTREKARKKKVKVEVKKVGFIPHNQRNKGLNLSKVSKHIDDSWKAIPKDNCYVGRYYRWAVYSVAEAIQCHRETHDPTMYNVPNAPLEVEIELNMQAEKANRFVDNFNRMAMIPHKFDHGDDRKILAFTKDNNLIAEARKAGATLVGGVELIKDIQNGDLLPTDYDFIIAHSNILPELVSLRGLLKRKFPNPRSETLGTDLTEMIKKFKDGVSYVATKDEHQQDYGLIKTCIGSLDMDAKHLEENLVALLKDVQSMRPKREGKFITRVLLKSPPSSEQLKIDPFLYVAEEGKFTASKKTKPVEAVVEEDEEEQAVQQAN